MERRRWHILLGILTALFLIAIPWRCGKCSGSAPAKTPEKLAELRKKLTQIQFQVTQENGTEAPFGAAYKEVMAQGDGIYVDIVSGEPLFSSREKFDSKTGWPSFYRPLKGANIVEKTDFKIGVPRTEVRSKVGDSHLGHVFDDGPEPTGLRYCINAAALRFVPAEKLQEEGYEEFISLFEKGGASKAKEETITLAGGCFWGVEAVFENVKGIKSAISGYTGGQNASPTYEQVASGNTGHAESVRLIFDSSKISLAEILKIFFEVVHDPTQLNRQGPDIGTQYRSAIFYENEKQKREIETFIESLTEAKRFENPIVTQINKASDFYDAEEYHQNFAAKNPKHPYIVFHDFPKVEKLKASFPDLTLN